MNRRVGSRIAGALFVALLSLSAFGADQDLSVNARLLAAARSGDSQGVARELAAGASPNARNRLGETALLVALKRNDLVLARAMLDAGTDVNQAAVNGVTPLMAAAYGGNAQLVAALIAKGAAINARDRLKKTAMIYAAGEGHTEVVQVLLAKGIDANAVYENDLTALMWAAGFGQTATVKALLAAGARRSARQPWKDRARHRPRQQPFGNRSAARNDRYGQRRRRYLRSAVRSASDCLAAQFQSPFARASGFGRRARASAPR